MNRADNPCYGCVNRNESCHAKCKLYSEYCAKAAEERKKMLYDKIGYFSYRYKAYGIRH